MKNFFTIEFQKEAIGDKSCKCAADYFPLPFSRECFFSKSLEKKEEQIGSIYKVVLPFKDKKRSILLINIQKHNKFN